MQIKPHITKQEADAFVAPCFGLIAWLMGLIARFGASWRSKRLRAAVAMAEHFVERIVFLWAAAEAIGAAPPHARGRWPKRAPPGFRRRKRCVALLFRSARIARRRASLPARLARLAAVLAAPCRYVARFAALLLAGYQGGLIAIAPPGQSWRDGPARAAALSDTS